MDHYFPFIFPFLFIGIWIFVSFLISRFGYHSLVKKYKFEGNFFGTPIGLFSATINHSRYSNSLFLHFNDKGIMIKSLILFRWFHPAIFIPYTHILSVKQSKTLFTEYVSLEVGSPFVAEIALKAKTFKRFEKQYNKAISN